MCADVAQDSRDCFTQNPTGLISVVNIRVAMYYRSRPKSSVTTASYEGLCIRI